MGFIKTCNQYTHEFNFITDILGTGKPLRNPQKYERVYPRDES